MEKHCEHCGKPFEGQRASKKYCSETCRQMAYIKRNGLIKVRVADLSQLKTNAEHHNTAFKMEQPPLQREQANSSNLNGYGTEKEYCMPQPYQYLKKHTPSDNKSSTDELSYAFNYILVPRYSKNEAGSVENRDDEEQDDEDEIRDITAWRRGLGGKDDEDDDEDDYDYLYGGDDDDDLEDDLADDQAVPDKLEAVELADEDMAEEANAETPKTIAIQGNNVNPPSEEKDDQGQTTIIPASELSESKQGKGDFQWTDSKFIGQTETIYASMQGGLIFRSPLQHWDMVSSRCVSWTNRRLRCLLECLLNFSQTTAVDGEMVSALALAFDQLARSEIFRKVPLDYPFSDLIEHYAMQLDGMLESRTAKIKIQFRPGTKARLLAIREMLLPCTTPMHITEMDFTSPAGIFVLPKTETEKNKTQPNTNEENKKAA